MVGIYLTVVARLKQHILQLIGKFAEQMPKRKWIIEQKNEDKPRDNWSKFLLIGDF